MTQAEVSDHILAAYTLREANDALNRLLEFDRLHGTLGDSRLAVEAVCSLLNPLFVDHIAAVYQAIDKSDGNGTEPKPMARIAG